MPVSLAMRLVALRAHNFRALAEVDVTFPDGLIGIMGANGSGKTTLLGSMLWAMYGTDGVRWKKDGLLGPNDDEARVEFEFSLGGDRYLVRRTLRGKGLVVDAKLECNGALRAAGNDGVTGELVRLLGGPVELGISRFVAQKQLNALSAYDPAPRKRLILRLLGVESVEEAIKSLGKQLSEFDQALKARRSILPDLTDIEAKLVELRRRSKALETEQHNAQLGATRATAAADQAEAALTEIETAASAVATHTASLAIIDTQLRDLDDETARLDQRDGQLAATATQLIEVEASLAAVAEHTGELATLREAADLTRRIPELEAQERSIGTILADLDRQLAAHAAKAAMVAALSAREVTLEQVVAEATTAIATAAAERTELRGVLMRCREEEARVKRQLADLDAASTAPAAISVCPTCGQDLDDATAFRKHLAESLASLAKEERAVIARGTRAKQLAEVKEAERAAAERELLTVRQSLIEGRAAATEVRLLGATRSERADQLRVVVAGLAEARQIVFDAQRHAALEAEHENQRNLIALQAQLAAQLADRERLAADRERLAERRATYTDRLAAAQAAAQAAGYDPLAHEAARGAANAAREARRGADLALAKVEGDVRLVQSELARVGADKQQHARLLGEIAQIVSDRAVIELTREMMERFKLSLIGRIRPALSRKASILLRELTGGRYEALSLDEDYEISIGTGGRMRSIRDVSGGEEDLANLCLRMAISELINESTGVGSTFIVLDEVLGSQDAEREAGIMDLLPRLHGHFGQILMVAHKPAAQDRFPIAINADFDPVTETSRFVYPAAVGAPAP